MEIKKGIAVSPGISIAKAMIIDHPRQYEIYKEPEYTYNNIRQYNRNTLILEDPSVDGLKTGHTKAAGYCLVASAQRDEMRLISVVLGTDSVKTRTKSSQALLNYGFRFYETHQLYSAGDELTAAQASVGKIQISDSELWK